MAGFQRRGQTSRGFGNDLEAARDGVQSARVLLETLVIETGGEPGRQVDVVQNITQRSSMPFAGNRIGSTIAGHRRSYLHRSSGPMMTTALRSAERVAPAAVTAVAIPAAISVEPARCLWSVP
jgi:hypothetical protein